MSSETNKSAGEIAREIVETMIGEKCFCDLEVNHVCEGCWGRQAISAAIAEARTAPKPAAEVVEALEAATAQIEADCDTAQTQEQTRKLYELSKRCRAALAAQSARDQPDHEEGDMKSCTCKPSCPSACKGSCGCECCQRNYGDFLSSE